MKYISIICNYSLFTYHYIKINAYFIQLYLFQLFFCYYSIFFFQFFFFIFFSEKIIFNILYANTAVQEIKYFFLEIKYFFQEIKYFFQENKYPTIILHSIYINENQCKSGIYKTFTNKFMLSYIICQYNKCNKHF